MYHLHTWNVYRSDIVNAVNVSRLLLRVHFVLFGGGYFCPAMSPHTKPSDPLSLDLFLIFTSWEFWDYFLLLFTKSMLFIERFLCFIHMVNNALWQFFNKIFSNIAVKTWLTRRFEIILNEFTCCCTVNYLRMKLHSFDYHLISHFYFTQFSFSNYTPSLEAFRVLVCF